MYRVIKGFYDIQDEAHYYLPGDVYPREGYKPSAKRISELSGHKNRQKTPLIKEEPEEKKRKAKK